MLYWVQVHPVGKVVERCELCCFNVQALGTADDAIAAVSKLVRVQLSSAAPPPGTGGAATADGDTPLLWALSAAARALDRLARHSRQRLAELQQQLPAAQVGEQHRPLSVCVCSCATFEVPGNSHRLH